MKSKQGKFILSIIVAIIIVIVLGFILNNKSISGPGKYDDFAKALKSQGAEFYGAFWCPHCQSQKALFGSSKKYMPYTECSNPNRSQTQVCVDKNIETYPTWYFKDGITVVSSSEPITCKVQPSNDKTENPLCANLGSQYVPTWKFPEHSFSVKSPTEPVKEGNVWKFTSDAFVTGEIPLEFLAKQINFTLPQ